VTIPRLLALHRYWAGSPPLHESFAEFAGTRQPITPPAGDTPPTGDDDPFAALQRDFAAITSL